MLDEKMQKQADDLAAHVLLRVTAEKYVRDFDLHVRKAESQAEEWRRVAEENPTKKNLAELRSAEEQLDGIKSLDPKKMEANNVRYAKNFVKELCDVLSSCTSVTDVVEIMTMTMKIVKPQYKYKVRKRRKP